ncbi:MAG TPA: M20/M25/M40 family metallo-hydrolase [Polyangiaceae bacterium]|jgi:glutamate carboxypeptidase|nr:M20/M25/M40 family metallo-hydrolase [Polyangiaceae bacterium]
MASHADEATAWLSDKARPMADATATLVEVNSYTENPEGGRKVGALLRSLFAGMGLEVFVRPSERFADHLIFRSRPELPNRGAVALVGHLDTVFAPGTFEGYRVDGDLARGPGVLDMKGGLVVIAYALKALAATGGLDAVVPVRIVVVSDEETGSPEGQGVLAAAITGSNACLVFEAGRAADAIVTRRKGTGGMTAIAHGRAAHAGNHHQDGANAVWALARFVDAAQALTSYDRGVTINAGSFHGGHSKNTVPDHAEAQLDLRFLTRAEGEQLVNAVRRAAEEAAASVPGTRIDVLGGVTRSPLERTEASARLASEYAACAVVHGLGTGEAPLIGGGSDASTAAVLGIPAIDGLGPRGEGFHTKQEHIEIASLVPKAQALARFLAQRPFSSR